MINTICSKERALALYKELKTDYITQRKYYMYKNERELEAAYESIRYTTRDLHTLTSNAGTGMFLTTQTPQEVKEQFKKQNEVIINIDTENFLRLTFKSLQLFRYSIYKENVKLLEVVDIDTNQSSNVQSMNIF